ncbi:hypothetical protein [Pseudomonas frederiksbergensis]|uniref:Uncharacterized protein n=1 Tax=Pseudomonas frederiksbergensis TaxID=104087 RepID=A0A6L5C342_9PSED|nr:hypothetical protein [Pseudomonas frederiksbergensis]KAF2394572.1 hypothetical protein FX983_02553 [Pseudomonas frederiksbergensis]
MISEEVSDSLQVVQADPLILCLQYPLNRNNPMAPVVETLELAVCVQVLNAKGQWISRTHIIHLNPRGEGHFPSLPPNTVTEHPPVLLVETHLLETVDHAKQPG